MGDRQENPTDHFGKICLITRTSGSYTITLGENQVGGRRQLSADTLPPNDAFVCLSACSSHEADGRGSEGGKHHRA